MCIRDSSYNATTFMFYTGAPQNTARKPIDQLRVEEMCIRDRKYYLMMEMVECM